RYWFSPVSGLRLSFVARFVWPRTWFQAGAKRRSLVDRVWAVARVSLCLAPWVRLEARLPPLGRISAEVRVSPWPLSGDPSGTRQSVVPRSARRSFDAGFVRR